MISGSEVAFFSLDASKWKKEEDKTSVMQIKKLLQKPNHLISNNINIKQFYKCCYYYTIYIHN